MYILAHEGRKAVLVRVDKKWYKELSKYTWWIDKWGYAKTNIAGKIILMHQLIGGYERTDHKNRDTHDNREINLRPATKSQNAANTTGIGDSTSKYKGVCWRSKRQKWQAAIMIDKKSMYLGLFATEIDAAKAYNEAATRYFGEFAYINEL